jgi:hypothetical protein
MWIVTHLKENVETVVRLQKQYAITCILQEKYFRFKTQIEVKKETLWK